MISWIQNTLERKGRIVFIILLAVVIVSFVFVIGETPGCVSSEPGTTAQKFYGYSLNAETDSRSREMVEEVIISSIVNRGQQPQNEQMLTQEFLSRIALLELADLVKIPEPNQDAFVQYLASIPFFQNENGDFDPNQVTSFLDMTQLSRQFSESTINAALSNDFRIQQLMNSIATPGFTLPYEIEEQARRSAARYSISLAELTMAEVDLDVEVTEQEIEEFFTQQVEAYRIPETRALSVAYFSPEDFTAEVSEPTDLELKTYFSNNRSAYLNADADDPASALPPFEEVREQVLADWKSEQALGLARQNSEDFVYALFDQNIAFGSPRFEEVADSFSAEIDELPPMVGSAFPTESALPRIAFEEAARLDNLRYYSDPIRTEKKGIAVILLTEIIPSQIPELETVRESVISDFRAQAKQEAFIEKGKELREEMNQMIAEGVSFPEAAESLGLEVSTFSNVGWMNIPEGLNNSFVRRSETLPNDQVSAMIVSESEGTFLFVDSRESPRVEPSSEEYQRAKTVLSNNTSRLFVSSFVSDLIQAGTPDQAASR